MHLIISKGLELLVCSLYIFCIYTYIPVYVCVYSAILRVYVTYVCVAELRHLFICQKLAQ